MREAAHPRAVARTFGDALAACLHGIPRGRAVPCADVARALGDVRAARAVASWIRSHPDVPGAHRIVRADGTPLLQNASARLAAEGVPVAAGLVAAAGIGPAPRGPRPLARLRAQQDRLAARVSERDGFRTARRVAAADVAYDGERAHAAAIIWDAREAVVLETAAISVDVDFPYIPTYLAFREFPPVRAALSRLRTRADVLLVDGHGRLHPASFGFACYAGVLLGIPTIGVAKRPLVGHLRPDLRRGDEVPIEHSGSIRGIAWTPPGGGRPLFVSVGHRVSLGTAMCVVREVTASRMPEPLRLADGLARKRKRAIKGEMGSGR